MFAGLTLRFSDTLLFQPEQGQGSGEFFVSSFLQVFRVREKTSLSTVRIGSRSKFGFRRTCIYSFFFWFGSIFIHPSCQVQEQCSGSGKICICSFRREDFRNKVWLLDNVLSARFLGRIFIPSSCQVYKQASVQLFICKFYRGRKTRQSPSFRPL